MSFEEFVEKVGEHFKALPKAVRDAQLKEIYERETGKSVKDRELQSVVKTSKKDKKEKAD